MGWLSTFNLAAGLRRYLLGGVVTSIVTFWNYIAELLSMESGMILGVPSWAAGIIVALGFCFYWVLERLVILEKRIKGARVELSLLRTKGVQIRNSGQNLQPEKWFAWEPEVMNWNDEVILNIEKIDKGCAEWFSVLDVVPPPRVGFIKLHDSHAKLFREHDFRVMRLGDLIQNLWEK